MRTLTWAVVVVAGMGLARPVLAGAPGGYDPVPPSDAEAEGHEAAVSEPPAASGAPAAMDANTSTITVEEVRSGAGSMEPATEETPQERSDQVFVANVWNSP
jgi:hypothetical protein